MRTATGVYRPPADLPEEVALGRHHEVGAAPVAARAKSADDRRRHAVDLPHDELGRARDLVRDGDLCRVQLVANRVARPPQVEQGGHAGDAERDVGRPRPPRPPERVGHDDGDGNPNVHGARERDFKASVGGVSNQDPLTGGWLNTVNFDSIEEVEVITAGAGAEYGRAQGGFANIIQKQGSNDFEGTFNFLYRSSKLDGNGATAGTRYRPNALKGMGI